MDGQLYAIPRVVEFSGRPECRRAVASDEQHGPHALGFSASVYRMGLSAYVLEELVGGLLGRRPDGIPLYRANRRRKQRRRNQLPPVSDLLRSELAPGA